MQKIEKRTTVQIYAHELLNTYSFELYIIQQVWPVYNLHYLRDNLKTPACMVHVLKYQNLRVVNHESTDLIPTRIV